MYDSFNTATGSTLYLPVHKGAGDVAAAMAPDVSERSPRAPPLCHTGWITVSATSTVSPPDLGPNWKYLIRRRQVGAACLISGDTSSAVLGGPSPSPAATALTAMNQPTLRLTTVRLVPAVVAVAHEVASPVGGVAPRGPGGSG
ncbi:hypothetical protein EYF80_047969 [Liparis tanakae]|uniref:Uncharacterized protein n=1 Tax=Liparis tanakae TaxID=230148 RepID=A0A4Z2FNG6_9TELE|nr:hypothetical protein EYF80_047969 [Liparis tanakae]